jgi:uncharacterized protein (DUF58 family)
MPESSDRIAISISHVFSGQAEGYFAITMLGVIALATLACAAIYVVRRFPTAQKPVQIERRPTNRAVKASRPHR